MRLASYTRSRPFALSLHVTNHITKSRSTQATLHKKRAVILTNAMVSLTGGDDPVYNDMIKYRSKSAGNISRANNPSLHTTIDTTTNNTNTNATNTSPVTHLSNDPTGGNAEAVLNTASSFVPDSGDYHYYHSTWDPDPTNAQIESFNHVAKQFARQNQLMNRKVFTLETTIVDLRAKYTTALEQLRVSSALLKAGKRGLAIGSNIEAVEGLNLEEELEKNNGEMDRMALEAGDSALG